MHTRFPSLEAGWFARPAEQVAREMLGTVLLRTLPDGTELAGYISETEAYVGPEDCASHAFGGRRTARNKHMWSPPGTAYVYFTYGMHHCFNVSCLRADHPAAVLVRAVFPILGLATMRELRSRKPRKHPLRDSHLCDGPGKLCQAFGIDRDLDGENLLQSTQLSIRQGVAIEDDLVRRTPRIGIGSAGDWVEKPLRWLTRVDPG